MRILGGKKNSQADDVWDTLLGEGSNFKGELFIQGSVRVDGKLDGNLSSTGHLTVGKKGILNSPTITCKSSHIAGTINGDLVSPGRTFLASTAKIEGKITTDILIIEEGAYFNGSADMGHHK